MKKYLPFWWKWRVKVVRERGGFFVQVLLGFIILVFQWKYPKLVFFYLDIEDAPLHTGLSVGWIPWRVKPGQSIAMKTIWKVKPAEVKK